MSIQAWLGETSKRAFVEQNYLKLPFSRSGGGRDVCRLGSWETLGEILAAEDPDVMIVRAGQRVAAETPRSLDEAQALSKDGCTILARNAQRHHDELAQLAQGFEEDFRGDVNIHIYATPAGQHGFGWHYDAEEVFILQTTGRKEYSLRKNTVHPWPLEETLPEDMKYEREIMPLMRCLLGPGDWLYIPSGYWHKADALAGEEAAISLAIGVMAPSAVDLLDLLRRRAPRSLLWRQRLPTLGDASPLDEGQWNEQMDEVCRQLIDDLRSTLSGEEFRGAVRDYLLRRET